MKINFKIVTVLIVITLLGGLLRFYKLTTNPPGLTGDELAFGYSAYSILQTGRDEHGKFLPIVLESTGDYKNPVPAYLMIPAISLFGLNEFSVRLQNALIGTLMIPVFWLFLLKIFKDRTLALTGAFFMSISSWHILYSRYAYEPLIASFFVLLGIWFFMKMFDGKRIWAILSAFFLVLTMYTAFAPRLFIPVFILTALIFNLTKFKTNWDKIIIFIFSCSILIIPLAYVSLFGGASTRFSMVFIGNDIDFLRYVVLGHIQRLSDVFLLMFFWAKRYLDYLQPGFLFFNGLGMTQKDTIGLGLLYLFEIPWLLVGTLEFIKRKIPYKRIFVIWLTIGILPDSLTNNQQFAGRLLHVLPVVILISSLGAITFFKWIFSLSKPVLKITLLGLITTSIILSLTQAFLVFAIDFPRAKGEAFDEGIREAVNYIHDHQNNYQQIVFDTRRGIDGPYLVINVQTHLLFYLKYNPKLYQDEPKDYGTPDNPLFNFDKYTFRNIDWIKDSHRTGTLFIGSPWSFPANGLKEGELLTKIYMTDGNVAYYIVSPRPDHQ